MVPAIGEVDDQADDEPDDQARPVPNSQLEHHVAVHENAEHGNERNPRRTERPGLAWILPVGLRSTHLHARR